MIIQVLWTAFFALVAGFVWWRFYVSMRDQKADVRGAVFARREEPVSYWFCTSLMGIGAVLTSVIALIFVYGVISGLPK